MQWLKTKLLSVFVFALLFAYSATVTLATAPNITGKVENKNTGEGVSGLVIKWTDDEDEVRYAITGADGTFIFPSWHLPASEGGIGESREAESNRDIDTDYDGVADDKYASTRATNFFGCKESPHTFEVLPRPNMGGVFESTSIDLVQINNGIPQQNIGLFYFVPSTPPCPGNIKKVSCDQTNKTVTMSWDAPPGGADGYKLYFDKAPLGVQNDGDVLNSSLSNQLQRTQAIAFDTRYLLRIKSLKTVNGNSVESESCLAEFQCDTPPPPPICLPGIDDCDPTDIRPDATLTGALCSEKPNDFYYDFTLSNINTYGQQFVNSYMMMVFNLNSQTQEIMDFLNGNPQGPPYTSTADFSQWREEGNTTAQQGHYFGYYVQTFNSLPASNSLNFRLNDNTRIGTKTIGQLRQFLEDNNYSTQYVFKANISARTSSGGDLFNSHVPLPGAGKIDLARTQDAVCREIEPTECEVGTCPTISISNPAQGEVVRPVSNRFTVTWTSSNPAINNYEVLVYDTTVYDAESANTAYETAMAAGTTPIKVRRYTATGLSQQVLTTGLGNAIGIGIRGVVPSPICSESPAPIPPLCDWNERDVTLGYTVTGKFYLDNQCQSTSTADEIAMTGQISANGETIPLNGATSYSFNLPYTGAQDIVLEIGNADYICAYTENALQCPTVVSSNTCKITNVTGPGVKNFYVQTSLSQFKSWWQVRGGLVYGNNGISSNLPFDTDGNTSCDEPFCKPFLLRREFSESLGELGEKTAGIPMTNTGGFSSVINGYWTDRDTNNKAHTEGTNNLLTGELKEDSSYFKKLLANDVTAQTSPGTISSLPADTRTVVQDAEVWHFTGDLTIKPSSTWNVSNKQVVIVDGSIRFETDGSEQLITVNRGGFLAFIASNDITFDNEIGWATADVSETRSNIEGIFIADRNLKIEGNGAGGDKKFIGAGTFVGWSNVLLQRRFDNPDDQNDTTNQLKNTNMAVESIFYRPDFTVNAPEFMRNASYTWKEVN